MFYLTTHSTHFIYSYIGVGGLHKNPDSHRLLVNINLPSVLQNVDPDLPPLASHGLHLLKDRMNLKMERKILILKYCQVKSVRFNMHIQSKLL